MKIIKKTNFRVVVEPRRLGDYGALRTSDTAFGRTEEQVEKDYKRRCEEIAEQITRHVDNVSSVDVDYDTDAYCSHCGYGWEVDPETKEPVCCNTAIEEFNEQKTAKA